MAKYDNLLKRGFTASGVTVLQSEAPNKKSRPTSTDKVLIFTDTQKFSLLEEVIFENTVNGNELVNEYDVWAVFAENGKLYIIWEYETLRKYFPNCKSI